MGARPMIFSEGWPAREMGENMVGPTIDPASSGMSEASGRACSRKASTRLASSDVSNADTFTAWTAAQSLGSSARISMVGRASSRSILLALVHDLPADDRIRGFCLLDLFLWDLGDVPGQYGNVGELTDRKRALQIFLEGGKRVLDS